MFTNQTPGIAWMAETGRVYILYVDYRRDPNNATARRVRYVSSADNGATWTGSTAVPSTSFPEFVMSGIGFTCMNDDTSYLWPCSIVYVDLNTQAVEWRPARPHASQPTWLTFGDDTQLGADQSFGSRTPAMTAGPVQSGGQWVSVGVYDRDGDVAPIDYAARAVQATAAAVSYDNRSFNVGGGQNQWLGSTYPLMSGPAVGHFATWQTLYLLFTKDY